MVHQQMPPEETITVVFEPGGQAVQAPPGSTLMEAAETAGIVLWAPCGRRGTCGQCRVIISSTDGCAEPSAAELEHLPQSEIEEGWRLACQAQVVSDVTVSVSPRFAAGKAQVLEMGLLERAAPAPNVVKRRLQLPRPTLEDPVADLHRLERALGLSTGTLNTGRRLAASLPGELRRHDFNVTATVIGDTLVEISGPDAGEACCGAALDIGTTTIVAYLVELRTGELLATASTLNPQATYGADVISRLDFIRRQPDALDAMHRTAVQVTNSLIGQACDEAGVDNACVYELTVVGNTCMHHLFLGIDPSNIAVTPFTPAVTRALSVPAARLGVDISPVGMVECLPNVAGYVGADIVGAIVATGLDKRSDAAVMIDIGTNGEVALWTGEELLCCSCAAGPAFEGAQITHGMRAMTGAIDHVACRDEALVISTIDDAKPTGLCGSGLLDAAAVLLDCGLLASSGRLGHDAADVPASLRERIAGTDPNRRFVLARPETSAEGTEIALTQRDVRQLQLASGAIRAGTELLLAEAGLARDDVSEFLLAGAFGSYIRPASALRIGMLPNVPADRIRSVGNAAGMGAVLCLTSVQARAYATELARRARYVELSARLDFQEAFAEAMTFP